MVGGGGEGWSARQIHPANGLCGCKAAIRHNTRKGPFSVSTSEVVVPFLNSFIASTVAVNQTPLSFYCPRSRSSRRSIVTTRGRTHSLLHTRITNGNSFVLLAIATSPTYLPTCLPACLPTTALPYGSSIRANRRRERSIRSRLSFFPSPPMIRGVERSEKSGLSIGSLVNRRLREGGTTIPFTIGVVKITAIVIR